MSKMRLLFVACAMLAVTAVAAVAAEPAAAVPGKEDLSLLLQTIRSNRKAFVSVNLALTPDEAAKFWPLYDEYQKELTPYGDRLASIVDEYIASFRTLSNEKALELIKGYNEAEAGRLQVRRSFIDRFAAVVPGRTVARFYQIENKIDAVLRYDLAATIPVVEQKAEAPAN
jgi:hypothetical protein